MIQRTWWVAFLLFSLGCPASAPLCTLGGPDISYDVWDCEQERFWLRRQVVPLDPPVPQPTWSRESCDEFDWTVLCYEVFQFWGECRGVVPDECLDMLKDLS